MSYILRDSVKYQKAKEINWLIEETFLASTINRQRALVAGDSLRRSKVKQVKSVNTR